MTMNAPMRHHTPGQPVIQSAKIYSLNPNTQKEYVAARDRLHGHNEWVVFLDGLAKTVSDMVVRKASPNKSGRKIDVKIWVDSPPKTSLFGGDRFAERKTNLLVLHLFAGNAGQIEKWDFLKEVVTQIYTTIFVYNPTVKKSIDLGEFLSTSLGFYRGPSFMDAIIDSILGRIDLKDNGPLDVWQHFHGEVQNSKKTFAQHVVKKLRGDILTLAAQSFQHGETLEGLQEVLRQALIKSIMDV